MTPSRPRGRQPGGSASGGFICDVRISYIGCNPLSGGVKMCGLVNNGTKTIFTPLILARFRTSSAAAVTPVDSDQSQKIRPSP